MFMKFCVSLCLFFCVFPCNAGDTVDDVIALHIKAHGGMDQWKKVTNMKLVGNYTSFSVTKPFTLLRVGDGRLHFEHYWEDHPVRVGHTPDKSWWVNKMMGKNPADAPPWAIPRFREWADMISPLIDYKEKGHKVSYVGMSDLEGMSALAIKVSRKEGSEETWYLDPQTYLAVGRISQGSDFGRPMEQVTFFDDYREVNGLKIPFVIETNYGIRHRVMEVAAVELNVDVQEDIFEKPFPEAMIKLEQLVGEWDLTVSTRPSPRQPWQDTSARSIIEPMLDGNMFMEKFVEGDKNPGMVRTWSHDQYRDSYTIIQTSSEDGLSNILRGTWREGVLDLDNLKTGTSVSDGSQETHHRLRITEVTDDGFTVESDQSRDGGERWFTLRRFTYRKPRK